MKQPRLMSFMESIVNVLVGVGVALLGNAIILPLLGFDVSLKQNIIIAAFMTILSIIRSFGLRRIFEALHIRRPLSPFMQAVIAERYRQIEAEGWSTTHDDDHKQGELADAGAAYAFAAGASDNHPPEFWPWDRQWFKSQGFRRNLVKGAALILAEGERFDRLRKKRAA